MQITQGYLNTTRLMHVEVALIIDHLNHKPIVQWLESHYQAAQLIAKVKPRPFDCCPLFQAEACLSQTTDNGADFQGQTLRMPVSTASRTNA